MSLKKTNAVISWILIILLLVHIASTQLYMIAGIFNMQLMMQLPKALGMICVVHICISLGIVFFMHDGSDFTKYGKLNRKTLLQRLSGIMIILLIHAHINLFASFIYENLPISAGKKIVVFIVEMIFFGAIFLHLDSSFTKSFITMGMIRSEKTERGIDIAARIFCVFGFAFTFVVLARFLVMWDPA